MVCVPCSPVPGSPVTWKWAHSGLDRKSASKQHVENIHWTLGDRYRSTARVGFHAAAGPLN